MKIFLYGGSFDPVHVGHTALIQTILAQDPDYLFVIPTGNHPEKKQHLFSPEERFLLLKLILSKDLGPKELLILNRFHIPIDEVYNIGIVQDDRIIIREDEIFGISPCYTIDTVLSISKEFPSATFHLVVGGDQAAKFSNWYKAEELASLVCLWYVSRDGFEADSRFSWNRLEFPKYLVSSSDIRKHLLTQQIQKIPSDLIILENIILKIINTKLLSNRE